MLLLLFIFIVLLLFFYIAINVSSEYTNTSCFGMNEETAYKYDKEFTISGILSIPPTTTTQSKISNKSNEQTNIESRMKLNTHTHSKVKVGGGWLAHWKIQIISVHTHTYIPSQMHNIRGAWCVKKSRFHIIRLSCPCVCVREAVCGHPFQFNVSTHLFRNFSFVFFFLYFYLLPSGWRSTSVEWFAEHEWNKRKQQ